MNVNDALMVPEILKDDTSQCLVKEYDASSWFGATEATGRMAINLEPAGAVNVVAVKSIKAGVYTPVVPNGYVKDPFPLKYFLTRPVLFARIMLVDAGVPVTVVDAPRSRLLVPMERSPPFRINVWLMVMSPEADFVCPVPAMLRI